MKFKQFSIDNIKRDTTESVSESNSLLKVENTTKYCRCNASSSTDPNAMPKLLLVVLPCYWYGSVSFLVTLASKSVCKKRPDLLRRLERIPHSTSRLQAGQLLTISSL